MCVLCAMYYILYVMYCVLCTVCYVLCTMYCVLYNCPTVRLLQVLTDIVDGDRPSHEEFMANLGMAAVKLQESLVKVIEYVASKDNLSQL